MNATHIPSLDEYWAALESAVPEFSAEEQEAAVVLYRELAKGEPVTAEALGRALGVSAGTARELLERNTITSFVYPDDEGRVLGFGGLAVAPMAHRFQVDGRMLWTWCAWDSLFIPEILGATVRVESRDPETGATVRLTVAADRIEAVDPPTTVVSFLVPDSREFHKSAANVMANFCHFVFFFASQESGERWARILARFSTRWDRRSNSANGSMRRRSAADWAGRRAERWP